MAEHKLTGLPRGGVDTEKNEIHFTLANQQYARNLHVSMLHFLTMKSLDLSASCGRHHTSPRMI